MKKNVFRTLVGAVAILVAMPAMGQVKIGYEKSEESDGIFHDDGKRPGGLEFSISCLHEHSRYHRGPEFSIGGGLGFGFIETTGAPSDLNTTMGKSLEIDWSNAIQLGYNFGGGHHLNIGMGFLWRNYRMTDHNRFDMTDEGILSYDNSYPAGSDPQFSRIKTFALTVPLLYSYHMKHGWKLTFGPELAFNNGRSKFYNIKTKYNDAAGLQKDRKTGVHVNPVNVNLVAGVTWRGLGVYARYSPTSVLDDEYTKNNFNFQSFSIGFRVLGF